MSILVCGLAIIGVGDAVDWSPTINTFLLVLLGIVSFIREYYSRKDAKEIKERAKQVSALTAEVHETVTGEQRDSSLRTRRDDK